MELRRGENIYQNYFQAITWHNIEADCLTSIGNGIDVTSWLGYWSTLSSYELLRLSTICLYILSRQLHTSSWLFGGNSGYDIPERMVLS